ncbi:copper amine oxidase N-terminal domain-containing protein [Paenibacillus sp. MSJ-6]|uniref:Copper amine oxidase N-terminal domain-containing protein n=1 Tax=Paenibacillus brevis TaxID=2841508 RepID=A0ABS6FP41_9BACL|nr:copper amine oxidase N-terminal domain-containing protein [Paenibacillus brevis]
MKKMVVSLLIVALMLPGLKTVSAAQGFDKNIVGSPKLAVLVDGKKIIFQGGDPFPENGRVQVPLRGVGEALGAEVDYDGVGKKVKYIRDKKSIELTLGSKEAIVDGHVVKMDTAAKAIQGRTFVPLRFVSENLGKTVKWDAVGNWVWIGSQEIPDITEVTELEDIKPYRHYYQGYEYMSQVDGKDLDFARVIDGNATPVQLRKLTIMDIWMVSDGKNDGIRVRYRGPDKLTIFFLQGNGDIRRRDAFVVDQGDGTYIGQFPIVSSPDNHYKYGGDWKNFKIKDINYFFFQVTSDPDDSIRLFSNPFK